MTVLKAHEPSSSIEGPAARAKGSDITWADVEDKVYRGCRQFDRDIHENDSWYASVAQRPWTLV
jgi:hypothetical protein